MGKPQLRLSYNPSIPFSKRTTFLLCVFYAAGFAGLLAWNFWSSAKGLQCIPYTSGNYQADRCEAAQLEFSRSYYTRPASTESQSGTIGTFPWQPLAFGNGTASALDYSILSMNWTADPLQCVMYQQYLVLDLATEDSIVNTCYYCSNTLRILCTSVDSQRIQVPDASALAYTSIANSFNQLSTLAHTIATTAQQGATIGSVRIKTQRPVSGLASGILPVDTASFDVILGSTIGSFPIYTNSSNSGVARLAASAQALSQIVEEATERDLQPSDNAGQLRTLQAPYICRNCSKQYKPVLEIIALLITGVFGVLTPAFTAAKLVAEWATDEPAPDPYIKPTPSGPPTPTLYAQQAPMVQGGFPPYAPVGQGYVNQTGHGANYGQPSPF